MKKIIAVVIAIIAILAMSAPALAEVPETVTIGSGTATPPYMIAIGMTPDTLPGVDGTEIYPEPAKPLANGTFSPAGSLNPSSDGWRLVKFYVEVGHVNFASDPSVIDSVIIDVNYPHSPALVNDPLYADRADTLKFEIHAFRSGNGWASSATYPYTTSGADTYPDGTHGIVPAMTVRELTYGTASDTVDICADENAANDVDYNTFLHDGHRVFFGTTPITYNADSAFDQYQLHEALVLEIEGWLWFHQPGVEYYVYAHAQTPGGASSANIQHWIQYQRIVGLWADFDCVQYGTVQIGSWQKAGGDRDLTTPQLTTIWNNGNSDAEVSVKSTRMVYQATETCAEDLRTNDFYDGNLGKTIEHFDATLYYTTKTGTVVQVGTIQYMADVVDGDGEYVGTVIINDNQDTEEIAQLEQDGNELGPVLLQSCRPAKIEFSVHPEANEGQAAGEYKGFLTVCVSPYLGNQPEVNPAS